MCAADVDRWRHWDGDENVLAAVSDVTSDLRPVMELSAEWTIEVWTLEHWPSESLS